MGVNDLSQAMCVHMVTAPCQHSGTNTCNRKDLKMKKKAIFTQPFFFSFFKFDTKSTDYNFKTKSLTLSQSFQFSLFYLLARTMLFEGSPEVMEAGKFMLSLMNVQSKFILSTLRLPQSLQTNLCPLDMMMSQRH